MKQFQFVFAVVATTFCMAFQVNADDEVKPLEVGKKAVNFELPVVGKKQFLELKDEYSSGPVVVVVLRGYPGYQCQICKQQVGKLINRASALAKNAHRVILVYPGDNPLLKRHSESFMGSRRLPEPFVLVRDDGMQMIEDWGLRWNTPNETAYPSTYIIDSNGRVAWKKISSSHAGRSTTEEILAALRKL